MTDDRRDILGRFGASGRVVGLSGAMAVSQLLTAAVYLVAARRSVPAEFGVAVVGVSLALAAASLVDFGSNANLIRQLSARELGEGEVAIRLVPKSALASGIALLAVVVGLLPQVTERLSSAVFAASALLALGTVLEQGMQVFLRALGEIHTLSAVLVTSRGLALGFTLLLGERFGVAQLALGLALGSIAGTASCLLIHKRWRLFELTAHGVASPWRGGAHFGLSSLAVMLGGMDTVVLSLRGGAAAAGAYGAVARWTQALGLGVTASTQASTFKFAGAPSLVAAFRVFRSSVAVLTVSVVGAVAVALAAPWLVTFLLGPEYASSAPVLAVLAIGTVPAFWNQMSAQILSLRGRVRAVSLVLWAGVFVDLGLVFMIAGAHGALGAAWASLTSNVVAAVGLGWVVFRQYAREKAPCG